MDILVTGANGQVGSELQFLAKQFPDFKFHFTDVAELNITDEAAINQLFAEIRPKYCINCAAYTAVDKAERNDLSTYFLRLCISQSSQSTFKRNR